MLNVEFIGYFFIIYFHFIFYQSSRRQHAKPIETVFPGPLQLVRQFTAPFPLQKCYEQMEQSMFYRTRVLQRPDGIRDWVRHSIICTLLSH